MGEDHCTVIATYRVKPESESAFLDLLRAHYPTLSKLGLVTSEPPTIYRGYEDGRPIIYEIFTWKTPDAPDVAHQTPEVMAIWEPMGELVEERNGRDKFEFPHCEHLDLS